MSAKRRTVIGTPYYISPEIINNNPYRFETDIWSLGVILYEIMKLEPPFQAKTLHLLSLKIVKGKYDDPGSMYSRDIKNLLSGLLQVDPKRRPKISDVLGRVFPDSSPSAFEFESEEVPFGR